MKWFGSRRIIDNPYPEQQVRPVMPTVKAPAGYRLTPPEKPKRAGRTAEQMAPLLDKYHADYRAFRAHNAEIQRLRAVAVGIERYRWLSVPGYTCSVALKNDGKVFRYDAAPPEGHVGEGKCDAPDWCRCVPRSIIPGFGD